MKGIVFNVLEEAVRAEHGEGVWDDLLDEAGVEGAYTSLGTYPDEQLYALVAAASSKLNVEPRQIVHWFGLEAVPRFRERFPVFFEKHEGTVAFLLTLNSIIHPEVRKLYPGAYVPSFSFEDHGNGRLVVQYHSYRNLCAFAEGLIQGAARQFGEQAQIEQTQCVHRGDDHCILVVQCTPLETTEHGR